MASLTRTALAAALAAVLVAGCEGDGAAPTPGPPTGGSATAVVDRPHFRGDLPAVLVLGRPVVNEDGCLADDAPEWVCDPTQGDRYLLFGDRRKVRLVEARMDLNEGGTSWTVTVRFAGAGASYLPRLRQQARVTGALVLVLDQQREVLFPAAVPDIEGGEVRLTSLTKPEAWALVTRITDLPAIPRG